MAEAGYISDQPWQFTYHRALSPQMVRLALAMAGCEPRMPRVVCELAFGQGLAITIHAACNPDTRFIGTDFNPGHVAGARRLAAAAGLANLELYGDDLAAFCAREDVPRPDLVAMMGTWTWLPLAQQECIIGFIARRLADDGVLCLDHCTLPGMSGFTGLCRMLDAFVGEEPGATLVDRIPGALRRAVAFMDTSPSFVGSHWGLRSLVEGLIEKSPSHVAHEYFNDHARPAFFAETAARLGQGGLAWVAPWLPHTGIDALHLPPRQSTFLAGIDDPHRREQLRDFALDTARRMDLFAKNMAPRADRAASRDPPKLGGAPLDSAEAAGATVRRQRSAAVDGLNFILARPLSAFDYKQTGAIGEVALARSHYEPLLQALGVLRPLAPTDLQAKVPGLSMEELCDMLAILVAKDMIQVCADASSVRRAMRSARALNAAIVARAPESDEIGYLGSPVTGTGVKIARHHQVFLLAEGAGISGGKGLAQFAAAHLKACGGRSLPPELQSQVLLAREAELYLNSWRPVYAALGIVDAD